MEKKAKAFWVAALALLVVSMIFGFLGMILFYMGSGDMAVESGTLAMTGFCVAIGALTMHLLAFYKENPYLEIGAISCLFTSQIMWIVAGWLSVSDLSSYWVMMFAGVIGDAVIGMAVPYMILSLIAKHRVKNGATAQERARIRQLQRIRRIAAAYERLRVYYETGRISAEEYALRKSVIAKRYGISEEQAANFVKHQSAPSREEKKQDEVFDFSESSEPSENVVFQFGDTEIKVRGDRFEIAFDGQTVKSGRVEKKEGQTGTQWILEDQNGKRKVYLLKEDALESEEGVRYTRK